MKIVNLLTDEDLNRPNTNHANSPESSSDDEDKSQTESATSSYYNNPFKVNEGLTAEDIKLIDLLDYEERLDHIRNNSSQKIQTPFLDPLAVNEVTERTLSIFASTEQNSTIDLHDGEDGGAMLEESQANLSDGLRNVLENEEIKEG